MDLKTEHPREFVLWALVKHEVKRSAIITSKNKETISEIKNLSRKENIPYAERNLKNKNIKSNNIQLFIAQNKKDTKELKNIYEETFNSKLSNIKAKIPLFSRNLDHKRIGRILGYPEKHLKNGENNIVTTNRMIYELSKNNRKVPTYILKYPPSYLPARKHVLDYVKRKENNIRIIHENYPKVNSKLKEKMERSDDLTIRIMKNRENKKWNKIKNKIPYLSNNTIIENKKEVINTLENLEEKFF